MCRSLSLSIYIYICMYSIHNYGRPPARRARGRTPRLIISDRLSNVIVYSTPSPPTKILDFRGFDSSKLLILKGGNSHVR